MKILKIILLITFFAQALAIIVLSFLSNKDEQGASGAIVGGTRDSYYGKNKGDSGEARIDLSMKIIFVTWVLNIIALYFVIK